MSYLLSIIIPTKDRYPYLKECLNTLLKLDSKYIEIIISDNSENNKDFLLYLKSIQNETSNIKYSHTSTKLSQKGNSDRALSLATGDYCVFIGDDDSVAEIIIPVAKYLKRNHIDACVCDVATYHWPDIVYEGKQQPSLSFIKRHFKTQKLNNEKVLKEVFSYGIQDIKFLARIYHGIVKRDVLLKVKDKCGSFYPGPSPDMANAIACTLFINQYIYINLPIIISGYSYKSAGGMGLRGAHTGPLSESKQLDQDVEKDWTKSIPKIWLGYTMWMESGIKALESMNRHDLIAQINLEAMYAKTYLRYPDYRETVLEYVNQYSTKIKFYYECFRFTFRYVKERTNRALSHKYQTSNRISLTSACEKVNNYLKIYETKF